MRERRESLKFADSVEGRRQAAARRKVNRRINDRKRFGESKFWTAPEERSLIPSTWPAFESECRKWGIPRSPVGTGFKSCY
jgi:hypothetical protein